MKIEFSTSGSAFKDEYADEATNSIYTEQETIRILQKIEREIEDGCTYGSIMDINGNKIGEWSL